VNGGKKNAVEQKRNQLGKERGGHVLSGTKGGGEKRLPVVRLRGSQGRTSRPNENGSKKKGGVRAQNKREGKGAEKKLL